MTLSTAGIDAWAAGIRHRMANDPGRQDLEDHILCNGFLFLEEYLEDILLGARSAPIIELTKTPGRRKDMSKKDRVATAASVNILRSPDKENVPVLQSPTHVKKAPTSFQKALLRAGRENQLNSPPQPLKNLDVDQPNPFVMAVDGDDEQEEEAVAVLVTPPSTRVPPSTESKASAPLLSLSVNGVAKLSDLNSEVPLISNATITNPGVDLSVIAEGNESAMSQTSLRSTQPAGLIVGDKESSYRIPADPNNINGALLTATVSYDPVANDDDDTQVFQVALDRTFNDSEPTSTASSFPTDPYARDYETHELPHVVAEHTPTEPSVPHSPQAPTLTRKASVPVLPSLPGPSPLRKSMRDPAIGGPTAGNMRPSATVGTVTGSRSSWLNKARDVTAKRASVVLGVKRKSGDLTGDTDHTLAMNAYARAAKVSKTNVDGGVSEALTDKAKSQGTLGIQPFRPIVPARAKEQPHDPVVSADGNSEGMMNILKRTVEGLGARVGKSMGKSLGGAAATAAAAEAKAAAEARLAQRETKGSDGTRQGRLSVSDLVGAYESGAIRQGKDREFSDPKAKGHTSPPVLLSPHVVAGSRASMSTTPPNSPPSKQSHTPLQQDTYAIPKFTVQRPLAWEPSYGPPESQQSQPSTQSTYVSSIFDDHSTWPQSSLGTEYTASQGLSQPKDSVSIHDPDPLNLSKDVGRGQGQGKFTALHDEISDQTRQQGEVAPLEQAVAPEAPTDRYKEQGNIVGHDHVAGSEEANGDTASSDITEGKSKVGSSQENSTTSLQSGFVAQASTLLSKVVGSSVSSALSASKRSKPERVKSIQLAAAAAKKQQEEADRKAARLREMDKRRAAIASKKADHDAVEKSKQPGDRQKREREEGPERNGKMTAKKVEDEVTKKRKVVVEIEKKLQGKKPLSKDKKELGGSRIGKPTLNTSLSQSQLASSSTSKSFKTPGLPASISQPSVKLVTSSQGEPKPAIVSKATGHTMDKGLKSRQDDVRQPSQTLHAQMQARVQAQMMQARQEEPLVPSESIELPDINSEYSNSDDEDRPRTFDPPDWAQSPVLGLALQSQSRLNPDDIFGPVKPLRMEEIFTTRHSRFRARTSSANWVGTDELTTDEQREYARRMGYLD